jgi:hypothetical protein
MSAALPTNPPPHRSSAASPGRLSRRAFLVRTGALATALGTLDVLAQVAWIPARPAMAATQLPDIQFDLDAFVPPAQTIDGVLVRLPTVTFKGAGGVRLTTAVAGDYFDNGSIQHLAHTILDLQQFYDVDDAGVPQDDAQFTERVQYMFRSTPIPSQGNADQFTNGGGPAFLPVPFNGTGDAARGAQGIGTPGGERRLGHIATLRRSSRTADGKPMHQRIDGPGLDTVDVPDGSVSRSCGSPSSYRRQTFSPRCAATRRHWTWRSGSTCRTATTGWSGTSPPPGGRTS